MTSSTSFAALECRVGLGRMSVPTEAIDVLGEYSVGSCLPLTDRLSYSVGVWGDDVVLSLSLARPEPAASRTVNGLVLMTPGTPIRWALEIVAPVGLVEVTALSAPQAAVRWLRTATLAHGGAVQLIDVQSLVGELDVLVGERQLS